MSNKWKGPLRSRVRPTAEKVVDALISIILIGVLVLIST